MKSKRIIGELLLLTAAVIVLLVMLRNPSRKRAAMAISEAKSPACEAAAQEGFCRALVVQLLPSGKSDVPFLKLNDEDLKWDQAESILHDVLNVRINRTVFLRSDTSVAAGAKKQMMDIIRRVNAERMCVIDPKDPPRWYPQHCPQGPAASLRQPDAGLVRSDLSLRSRFLK